LTGREEWRAARPGLPNERRRFDVSRRAVGRPRLIASWLQRRYVEQRRSAQDIATETGWSSQYVRDRLRDHGIPLRPRGAAASLPPVDPALAGWSAQELSLAQIAARTGYSPRGVRKLLHRAGLPSRAAGPVKSSPDPAGLAEVVRLYRDKGRSLAAVGAAFGRGPDWAKARVHAAGLAVRPGGTPRTELDVEQLRRWRLDEGLSLGEIATRAGRSATAAARIGCGPRSQPTPLAGAPAAPDRSPQWTWTWPPSPTSTSPAGSTTRRSPPGSECPPGG
jgi:AraC-like DNA-binding protein